MNCAYCDKPALAAIIVSFKGKRYHIDCYLKVLGAAQKFLGLLLLLIFTTPVMAEEITLSVTPRVLATNPYKAVKFHLKVVIEASPDNRVVGIAGDCGSDSFSSTYPTDDGETYDFYRSLIPAQECTFVATLFRVVKGKVVKFVATQNAGGNEWPLSSMSAPTRSAESVGAGRISAKAHRAETNAFPKF